MTTKTLHLPTDRAMKIIKAAAKVQDAVDDADQAKANKFIASNIGKRIWKKTRVLMNAK
jgi:hypothetical protein